MDAIFNAGIAFIVWFQSLGSWLVTPMKFFSFLGSENFFLFMLPLLYWVVDARLGLRIGVVFLISGGLNDILKLSLHGPRPYWFSSQVKAYAAETSFGVPSGHAQIAMGLWGTLAATLKRRWGWFVAIFLILMIGLSRLFLAVHFPHDVLLGWAIGALTLWAFVSAWEPVAAWAARKTLLKQVGLAFLLSVLMLVAGVIAYRSLDAWSLPADWLANAQLAGFQELPAPVSLETTITLSAVLFGMLAGAAWIKTQGGYDASGTVQERLLRLIPGLLGIFVLYFGLRIIFNQDDPFLAYFLRYLRYALVGLWVSGGAPWLFLKLKLAKNSQG
jgi:membrane-associated phospholipid phosphatase